MADRFKEMIAAASTLGGAYRGPTEGGTYWQEVERVLRWAGVPELLAENEGLRAALEQAKFAPHAPECAALKWALSYTRGERPGPPVECSCWRKEFERNG